MSFCGDDTFREESFGGKARLFPLPNVVMFPHALQALHVFEPRYVQLVNDCLSDDRLIALSLLAPGWEQDYPGTPRVHSVVCLTQVVNETRLSDGKYNILVLGVQRARITAELPKNRLFREAQLRLLHDDPAVNDSAADPAIRQQLQAAVRKLAPQHPLANEQFCGLFSDEIPLGPLTDTLGHSLPLPLAVKQRLLEETRVLHRAGLLMQQIDEWISHRGRTAATFPPGFSQN